MNGDEIVRERLQYLRNEVQYLKREGAAIPSFESYVNDVRLRRAVERSLQVAVEACLDIARRIIAIEGFRYPENNQDTFRVLVEEKIVPARLLDTLQEMARFRNLIVHDYVKIDDARVYGILKQRLGDFDAYARAIANYLSRS
ncbi:MAG: DUF86 domain-containing protein [Anaerolineae bacterium]